MSKTLENLSETNHFAPSAMREYRCALLILILYNNEKKKNINTNEPFFNFSLYYFTIGIVER